MEKNIDLPGDGTSGAWWGTSREPLTGFSPHCRCADSVGSLPLSLASWALLGTSEKSHFSTQSNAKSRLMANSHRLVTSALPKLGQRVQSGASPISICSLFSSPTGWAASAPLVWKKGGAVDQGTS